MKTLLSMTAIALTALAAANTASAFSFSPTSTHFAATGTLKLTADGVTVSCKTSLTGATTATGGASISGAKFSGSSFICADITPTGLPWAMTANSATKATIDGIGVSGGGSSCGPSNVPITVSKTGAFKFANVSISGGCMANGTLKTSPVIKIVK